MQSVQSLHCPSLAHNVDSKDCTGFRALTPSPPDTKLMKSSEITTCCATRINFTVC